MAKEVVREGFTEKLGALVQEGVKEIAKAVKRKKEGDQKETQSNVKKRKKKKKKETNKAILEASAGPPPPPPPPPPPTISPAVSATDKESGKNAAIIEAEVSQVAEEKKEERSESKSTVSTASSPILDWHKEGFESVQRKEGEGLESTPAGGITLDKKAEEKNHRALQKEEPKPAILISPAKGKLSDSEAENQARWDNFEAEQGRSHLGQGKKGV